MTRKRNSIICYSASPIKPNPFRVIIETTGVAVGKVIAHPAFQTSTAVYASGLAGHIIPQFHKKLITQGPVPAAFYVGGTLFQGKIDPHSPSGESALHVLKGVLPLLTKNQQKAAFRELSVSYGPKAAEELKKAIGYRGGASFVYPNWVSVYTKLYCLYLFCLFAVLFVETLNSEMEKNPEIQKSFYDFYSNRIVPNSFKLNKENFLLNCGYISDDIYLLNIHIDF